MKKKLIITLTILAITTAAAAGFVIPKLLNSNSTVSESYTSVGAASLHEVKIKDAIKIEDTKTTINLGNTITLEGDTSGVEVTENIVKINSAGIYNLTGTLTNGHIVIDSADKDTVKILLNGVNITSESGSAISILNGDTLFTSAENTENFISDSSNYTFEDENTDEPDSAIYSKDDISFNGTGSLTVNGNYKSAIKSKNDLNIFNGNYTITSTGDAVKGKDSVIITDGTFNITSGGDAISSTNTEEDTGYVEIHDGSFTITSQKDGIQAESHLIIVDGDYNITTGDGSVNGKTHSQDITGGMGGNKDNFDPSQMPMNKENTETQGMSLPDGSQTEGQGMPTDMQNMPAPSDMPSNNNNIIIKQPPADNFKANGNTAASDSSTTDTTSESKKALKAGSVMKVEGGTFNIDSADDSIHSNGDTIINDGIIEISSGDKGIHADTNLEINNGTINISKSYEGLEGSYITINNGTINITSSDDGMNASDSSGTNTFQGPGTQNDSPLNITINGGNITVDAAGDGLDTNGSLYINGGTTIVNGPVSGADSALDSDGKIQINGGTLIAAGSSEMLEMPDSSSSQNVISITLSSKEAGTSVDIECADGNKILNFTPSKSYSSLIVSSGDLKDNTTYKISAGETEIGNVTVTEKVNSITESGAQNSSGFHKGSQGGRGGKFSSDNSTQNNHS